MIKPGIYPLEAVQEYEKKLKPINYEERSSLLDPKERSLLEYLLKLEQVPLKEGEDALKALESTADNMFYTIGEIKELGCYPSSYSIIALSLSERLEKKMRYISLDMHRDNLALYLKEDEFEKAEKLIDNLIDFVNIIHERGLEIKQQRE
jgi:hypothetical protein